MAKYVVVSDKSGKKDQECINKVVEYLKSKGNDAVGGGVNSNSEARLWKEGKDTIGIFLVNGACLGSMLSLSEMVKKGHCSIVYIGMSQPIMYSPFNNKANINNEEYKLALVNDGSNWKQEWRQYNHKWTLQQAVDNIEGIGLAWGENCDAVAQAVIDGGGVDTNTPSSGTDGSTDSSTTEKKEPTPMSYLDMIKDLIKVWDGDVEVKVKQDKMYINKVPQPKPQLWMVESNNIVSGQAKITDYNSDTINTLNVHYDGHLITITDDYLINRFGEVSADLDAEKVVTDYSGGTSTEQQNTQEQTSAESSTYTKVVTILQKYYTVKDEKDWNTLTNKIRKAKTGDEVNNIIKQLTKKKGQENTSTVSIRHELQKELGLGY